MEKNILKKKAFLGPVFIVGMPRSGTKLLRGLLNEHPCINIPDIETEFLPTWLYDWEKFGDLSNQHAFRNFYHKTVNLSYFRYMKESGCLVDCSVWYNLCQNYTATGVFEALIRHDANIPFHSKIIWGDKSPSYIRYMPLLKKHFSESRFIHIIRDARDNCLSINRAWGKNMIRAAQRWYDDINKIQYESKKYDIDYLEIRYEDLITQPDIILKKICTFVDIEFLPHMIHLSKPAENLGAAKGLKFIKKDNISKYRTEMDPRIRKTIEEITSPLLQSCGYCVNIKEKKRDLQKHHMAFYQLLDGINLLKYYTGKSSFASAVKSGFLNLKYKR